MKNQILSNASFTIILLLIMVGFSCDQKNNTQQMDSDVYQETTIPIPSGENAGFDAPLSNNNAVKVAVNANDNLDWEEFKKSFHHVSEGPEDYPSEVAIGPWIALDDYEYRRVYRLENSDLWIQTFYKRIGSSNAIDPNVHPQALTLQEAETTGLGILWNDMIERGLFLTDSLAN